MKSRVICILLLFVFAQNAFALHFFENEKIAAFTIPKSGTHLLQVILEMMTGKQIIPRGYLSSTELDRYLSDPNYFILDHVGQERYFSFLSSHPGAKKILLIRDFRDVEVSAIDFLDRHGLHNFNVANSFNTLIRNKWDGFTEVERIAYVVKANAKWDKSYLTELAKRPFDQIPNELRASLASLEWHSRSRKEKLIHLISVSKWLQHEINMARKILCAFPDIYLLRYENLLDERGGGNYWTALHELENLEDFLGIALTPNEEDAILMQKHAHPRSWTFVKGKMERWQKEFDEEVKRVFKEHLGAELISWGYENSYRW